jgi:hypothetical protein
MSTREDRIYEEALALWQAVSEGPPPEGDGAFLLQAALTTAGAETYDQLHSPWLRARAMTWAVYDAAPPGFA